MTTSDTRRLILVLDQDGSGRHSRSRLFDYIAGFGMVALLFFGVLAFGAVEEWSTFGIELGAALLFAVWFLGRIRSGTLQLSGPLYLPALAFAGIIVLQMVLGRSSYEYATRYEALKYVTYGIAILLGSECFRTRKTRRALAVMISITGTLYAAFALIQDLTSNGKIFWTVPLRWGGWLYGSYVDHAHYAGLIELLVPFPLVLAMGCILRGGRKALAVFSAILMAGTIFLSGSRAGMAAFVLEMIIVGILLFRRRRIRPAAVAYVGLSLALLGFIVYLSKGQVGNRISDMNPQMRWQITRDSIRMVQERPLLGWGLGTFPAVYPRFRSFHTNKFVNAAHNDYAQLLVETGIAGFGVLIWFLFVLIRNAASRATEWSERWRPAVTLAAIVGCAGLLLHSSVDFNLQIPANAAFFYFLCGVAVAPPISDEKESVWETSA